MDLEGLRAELGRWLAATPLNRVEAPEPLSTPPTAGPLMLFEAPLLAVADASDPLWARMREPEVVGPHHLLPGDWLPGAVSVLTFFLPYTAPVRRANRIPRVTATEWLYGRYEGGHLVEALDEALADLLRAAGWKAVAPATDPRIRTVAMRSNWSERHAAYVAGLGTFSLSRSLITRAGSAGRLGSVITDAPLPPTLRPYEDREAWCGRCGTCIPRCPIGAISPDGKDHTLCKQWQDQTLEAFRPRYGCGKCQTAVGCERGIPPQGLSRIRPRT
ncbi:MAG TPA: hypothetical protein VK188_12545 [Holophaga sp.]|nr:hypothetical protein [Holophaga sp.]